MRLRLCHAVGQVDDAHQLVQTCRARAHQPHAVVGERLEAVRERRGDDLRRGNALAAVMVCSVESACWSVTLLRIAITALTRSRISPAKITCLSFRIIARMQLVKSRFTASHTEVWRISVIVYWSGCCSVMP